MATAPTVKHVWFSLIKHFISMDAYIDDGEVYVNAGPTIVHYPVKDPATLISLMERNPQFMIDAAVVNHAFGTSAIDAFCLSLFDSVRFSDQALSNLVRVAFSDEIQAGSDKDITKIEQSLTAVEYNHLPDGVKTMIEDVMRG